MKRIIVWVLAATLLLSACGQQPLNLMDISKNQVSSAPEKATALTKAAAEEEQSAQIPETLKNITIHEVMSDNQTLILGHCYDWVELYNSGEQAVSLQDVFITPDPSKPEALALGNMILDPRSYCVIALDEHAPFHLSEQGGSLYLTYAGQVLTRMNFGASQNGRSLDNGGVCDFPTPGQPNTEEGYLNYLSSQKQPALRISEALAQNTKYAAGEQKYYDFIEVENCTKQALTLSDYFLTDGYLSENRYFFPDITLQPGQYFVIYCSGNASLGSNHADFGIAPGETIYLAKNGVYIDALYLPDDLKSNESYGRSEGIPMYLSSPTPAEPNSSGWIQGIEAPQVSITPGWYSEKISVCLTGPGTIYYTTDGSQPNTCSTIYTVPIPVDGITTIRALCEQDGRTSRHVVFSYAVGNKHTLPVVTLTLPEEGLYGARGVFTNIEMDLETNGIITLYEENEVAFSLPVGFLLHGNDSRKGNKKNFSLRFRSEYGASKLEYPLFDDRNFTTFDSLLLKGGSEDWNRAMLRDELASELANGHSALYTQATKPVVLYINNQYWGVYYLRERLSAAYVAAHTDVSEGSVNIAYSTQCYAQAGNVEDYTTLKKYVQTHDMTIAENYAYLCRKIDLNSLMDWYIFRTYCCDVDLANIRRFQSAEHDNRWHWMLFDLDWGFLNIENPVSTIISNDGGDHLLIQAVLANTEGRDAFLQRYAYMLGTVLNEENINMIIDKLLEKIGPEMHADRVRWGIQYSKWEAEIAYIRDLYSNQKMHKLILQDIQKLFSLSDQEMIDYFGELCTALWGA